MKRPIAKLKSQLAMEARGCLWRDKHSADAATVKRWLPYNGRKRKAKNSGEEHAYIMHTFMVRSVCPRFSIHSTRPYVVITEWFLLATGRESIECTSKRSGISCVYADQRHSASRRRARRSRQMEFMTKSVRRGKD